MHPDIINRLPRPPETWAIPFEPAHVYAAGIKDGGLAKQALAGPAFTLIHHGHIAAMFGLVVPWPGLAEAWMIGLPPLKRIALPFTRGARAFCDNAAQSLRLTRIQIHVQNSNAPHVRWAKAAGFKPEAVLDGYMPDGSAAQLMARVYRRTNA